MAKTPVKNWYPPLPHACAHRKEHAISKINDDKTDAKRLTPGELSEEMAYIQQLQVRLGFQACACTLTDADAPRCQQDPSDTPPWPVLLPVCIIAASMQPHRCRSVCAMFCLQDEMKQIDEDLTEAEAKNRLYYLLGERTR